MLLRWDPFRELDRAADEAFTGASRTRPPLPMDAFRRGDRVTVHVDLPGVDPGTIDLTVERNVLTLRAERHWQPGEADEVLVHERPHGAFTRQLFLGETLDADHVEASYTDGVLTLTIPVAEAAKPRRLQVQVGDRATAITADSTDSTDSSGSSEGGDHRAA